MPFVVSTQTVARLSCKSVRQLRKSAQGAIERNMLSTVSGDSQEDRVLLGGWLLRLECKGLLQHITSSNLHWDIYL